VHQITQHKQSALLMAYASRAGTKQKEKQMALQGSTLVQRNVDALVRINNNIANIATVTHDGGAWEWASTNKREIVDIFKHLLDSGQFDKFTTSKGNEFAKVRLDEIEFQAVLEAQDRVKPGSTPRTFRNIVAMSVAGAQVQGRLTI